MLTKISSHKLMVFLHGKTLDTVTGTLEAIFLIELLDLDAHIHKTRIFNTLVKFNMISLIKLRESLVNHFSGDMVEFIHSTTIPSCQ